MANLGNPETDYVFLRQRVSRSRPFNQHRNLQQGFDMLLADVKLPMFAAAITRVLAVPPFTCTAIVHTLP
jgi:hypothetical protein